MLFKYLCLKGLCDNPYKCIISQERETVPEDEALIETMSSKMYKLETAGETVPKHKALIEVSAFYLNYALCIISGSIGDGSGCYI